MGEELLDRDPLPGLRRRPHVFGDRVLEAEETHLLESQDRQCRPRFGDRADDRGRGMREGLAADVGHAVALEKADRVVLHDADRATRRRVGRGEIRGNDRVDRRGHPDELVILQRGGRDVDVGNLIGAELQRRATRQRREPRQRGDQAGEGEATWARCAHRWVPS